MKHKNKNIDVSGEAAEPIKKQYDWIVKLLCVFCAFILWLYVMQVESPEFEKEIHFVAVKMTGTDVLESQQGLSVYSEQEIKISVTISGKRSVVSKVTSADIEAIVDVSEITEIGRIPLKIQVITPAGTSLVSQSLDNATVYVDENIMRTIPVKVRYANMNLPEPYELGELDLNYDSVMVTGPKSIVDKVSHGRIELDFSNKTSTFKTIESVTLEDAYNIEISSEYLHFSPQEIEVNVPIYTSATVPVEVAFKYGYLHEGNAKITVDPSHVTVRGDKASMAVGNLLTPIILDEKEIMGNRYDKSVTLTTADGTFLVDNEGTVQIHVEIDPSILSMEVRVPSIEVTGASGISYDLQTDMLNVMLRGPMEQLSAIRSADIYAEIDLSGYDKNSKGTVECVAKIIIDAVDTEDVYEVGEYIVKVRIN